MAGSIEPWRSLMPAPSEQMRILLVEDDELVADAVVRGLTLAGFTVDHAPSSSELARAALDSRAFRPRDRRYRTAGRRRIESAQKLRCPAGQATPVLMLTARYTLQDKIRAFDLGADDFLMKPFEQAELAARCRALIRRAGQTPSGVVRLGRLIDRSERTPAAARRAGDRAHAARVGWCWRAWRYNLGRVVSKERLLQALAGWEQELTPNAVETQVSRLRAKLGAAAVIRTIRGLGYRLGRACEAAGDDDHPAASTAAAAAGAGSADVGRRRGGLLGRGHDPRDAFDRALASTALAAVASPQSTDETAAIRYPPLATAVLRGDRSGGLRFYSISAPDGRLLAGNSQLARLRLPLAAGSERGKPVYGDAVFGGLAVRVARLDVPIAAGCCDRHRRRDSRAPPASRTRDAAWQTAGRFRGARPDAAGDLYRGVRSA